MKSNSTRREGSTWTNLNITTNITKSEKIILTYDAPHIMPQLLFQRLSSINKNNWDSCIHRSTLGNRNEKFTLRVEIYNNNYYYRHKLHMFRVRILLFKI